VNKQQLLKIFIINQTFHWFIVGIIVPVIALLQLEKGLNLFQIGISMAIYSGTIVLLELPTGGLSDTIGRKKVYLISLMIKFGAAFVLLITQDFQGIISGFLLLGMARAFSSGSMDAWFVDEFHLINPKGNLQEALAIAGFTIFYLTFFLYNGMGSAPHATIFNYQIPSEKRSTLLSFESLFLQIGGLLGALIMGYISNSFSITIAWFIG